jgi:uncharacterized protein
MQIRPPRENSEAELDAFFGVAERIGGFNGNITAEHVDGYMTALLCGVPAVAFDEWIVKMADDAFERAFADPEDRQRAERAVHARWAVIADQLDAEVLYDAPDQLRLNPLIQPWSDEERAKIVAEGFADAEGATWFVTGCEWVEGFFAALEDFKDRWPRSSDEEETRYADELIGMVGVVGLPDASEELRKHVEAVYGSEGADRERLIDDACFAVQDLRLWAVDHAPKPETRRVEKTPGRNDPCPCGSGKKFKKCHGA